MIKAMLSVNKPAVLIIGLVGYNLGDEAIAYSAANRLSDKRLVKIVTLRRGAIKKYGLYEVFFKPRSLLSWLNLLFELCTVSVVIIGGGSLVQDKLGGGRFAGVIGYLNLTTLAAKIFKKKIISLPIGVDDIDKDNYKLASNILQRFDRLTVRDDRSRTNAIKYLANVDAPEVMPDPAFLINCEDAPDVVLPELFPLLGNYVCLSLAKENVLRSDSVLIQQLTLAVSHWIDQGYSVVMLCMDVRFDDELSLYEAMHLELNTINSNYGCKIHVVVPKSINQAVILLRNSTALVAMRLHAIIIGYSYTKIFCISRTTKTKAICEELNIPSMDLESAECLENASFQKVLALDFPFDSLEQDRVLSIRRKQLVQFFSEIKI